MPKLMTLRHRSMGYCMTEVDEHDAVDRRFRLQGKQPAHRLYHQGRRPGGEEVYTAVKALSKSQDNLNRYQECQGCGLQKVAIERKCRVCETPKEEKKEEEIVVEGIKSITREVQVMNELRQGLQQVIVDEAAMSISPEGQADACIRQLRRDAMWLDRRIRKDQQEIIHIMKAVGTGEKEATPQEAEVLQTYLVGTKQILEERELWVPPVESEVMVLENTGTLVRKTPEEVKALVRSGIYIEIIPGKLLCSRKAPCGRRKARIVGCGNFGTPDETVTTSTGGIDAVALRVLMMVASQRGWTCGSTDIKSAFLQAPKRSAAHRVTLVKPPQLVTQLGVVPPGTMWAAEGALYGLRESPEDWTCHRNQCLRGATWSCNGQTRRMEQLAEANVWKILNLDGEVKAYLGTYVDDLIMVGPTDEVRSVLQKVETIWECSGSQVLETEGQELKFCGFQVLRTGNGYKLHQGDYIRDLCDKKGVAGPSVWKGTVLQDAEDEQFDITTLREAQTLVGELQWVTCRSRPDVCHATGVLSRAMHRRPREVCEQARAILTYLRDTADRGINFRKVGEHLLGEKEELKFPRGEADVEAYADASFAPAAEAYKSVHGTIVMVAGCPILWSSARQPFITGSTAEAELVAYTEVFQQAEGVATLLEALGIENVRRSLYGDNKSALALCQGDVGAWRTRHLRLRAAGLRAAVGCEVSGWYTHHVKGTELPADGLTKQLFGPSFESFVDQIAMKENHSGSQAQVKAMAVRQREHQAEDDWAIMMEQQPDVEVPQLQLTLVEGRTDNGTPCYIATAAPEGGSSGSGTISSTLPTVTTDWSTPDSTRAQADGSLGSAASACQGLHRRGGGDQQPKAMASCPQPPLGLQQEATGAYEMLMEANQAPSLSGSAESPYVFDWPDDDRISWSRLE